MVLRTVPGRRREGRADLGGEGGVQGAGARGAGARGDGAPDAGAEARGQGVMTRISMRRLRARPASVALLSIGRVSP